jgi:putative ABC transport system permease protein
MAIPIQLRQVVRRLARSPFFAGVTLLTLALGIGANAAIFGVVEGVLLRPLPYPHPEQLVGVWHTAPGVNIAELESAPSLYFIDREESRSFEDVGLWSDNSASVTGLTEPERVRALRVTDGTLSLLGVPPRLGRTFAREDDKRGAPATVVLSYGYWQSHFGGDPAVLGHRLVVDGEAHEVIGVMPRTFRFLDVKAELFLPMRLDRGHVELGQFGYTSVARLKPGVTLAQANADVARLIKLAIERFPAPAGFNKKMFEQARLGPNLRPFKRDLVGDIGRVLWVLMGTIGMVLLVACANVANLLLVRAEGRQQELAVRAALGASRAQLAREMLLESVLLALVGGALGLGVAAGFIRLLVSLAPANLPRLDLIGLDLPVLLFTILTSLLAGVLLSLIPILKYAGRRVAGGLRSGGRSASESRERHRARNGLVILQVALALVLLVGSGLMIRSFRALRDVEPGFARPDQVQTLRLSIPEAQVAQEEAAARMQQAILEKVRAIPGVVSAGLASSVPLDGDGWNDPIFAEDRVYSEGQIPPLRFFRFVTPGLLDAQGTTLVAGRDLDWSDVYDRRPVAMLSENLARELWGDSRRALGKRVRESSRSAWRVVVGVVGDVHYKGLDQKSPTTIYFPILMKEFEGDGMCRSLAYLIRTPRAGSEGLAKELRHAVWSVNPNLPLASLRTLESLYDRSMARTSFTMVMLALAGGMALVLGVVGIFGVISYAVTQRTREIGIRMALGARREELTRMFVRHGLLLSTLGAGLGLVVALALGRVMSALLFGVRASDPLTFVLVAAALVVAGGAASYLPARRVADVDPVQALRAD